MLKTNQNAATARAGTPKAVAREILARGGRLTKWKGKVASIAPSLLIFSTALSVVAAGVAGIASAQTIDTPVTTPQVVATDENLLITPTGSITVDNAAQAIEFTTDFTSTAINRGTITNTVSTGGGNIFTVRNEAGSADSPASFENHGVMRAMTGPPPLPDEASSFLTLKGLQFNEDVIADITNTGEVTVDSTYNEYSNQADAEAYHFLGDLTGDFTNSGDITATATSDKGRAVADGFHVSGNMDGNISNSGDITATAIGVTEATADGIFLEGTFDGALSNTGTVSATAESSGDEATAYAVFIEEDMTTDGFTNAGVTRASATAQAEASATAWYLSGDLTGNFTNTGTITAGTVSRENNASSAGVYVSGPMDGNISNSGTITATAMATGREAQKSGEARADGIWVNDTFDGDFVNTITGRISATANSSGDEAMAHAVFIDEEMTTGGITNAGTAFASATAQTEASATTWYLSGELTGDFTNTGTITAETVSRENNASSAGVYVSGPMDGNISNSGTITGMATGAKDARVEGIRVNGALDGTFSNTGTVSASAKSTGLVNQISVARAIAVYFVGEVTTDGITNEGVIEAISRPETGARAYATATARAWQFNENLTGDFTNSGQITVEANTDTASVVADGLEVYRNMVGDFTNSGTITVTGGAKGSAVVDGMDVGGTFTGDFANTGTVSARATSSEEDATARAYNLGGDLTGDISNSGTITATADGLTKAVADGIYLGATLDGDLLNAGTVTVRANGPAEATASAIYVGVQSGGMIRNSGTISASAAAQTGRVSGIYVKDAQGRIENPGMITVAASGGEGLNAYGLHVERHDGVISDLGRISARSENGKAYAVYLDGGTGRLDVDTDDRVTGLLRVGAHDVNLDARGGSAVLRFEDFETAEGEFTTRVSDGRSAWFVEDERGSMPVYAAVDPIDVLTSRDVVASHGNTIGGIAEFVKPEPENQALNEVSQTASSGDAGKRRFGLNGFGRFAGISAESSEYETLKGMETDLRTYDGNIGVTGVTDGGAGYAVGMGIFRAEGDTSTTDFETDALYLTAAYGRGFGTVDFAASLGFGWLKNEGSRRIAGSTDATAEYDSTVTTAHLGVGKAFDLGRALGLNGFGNIRYTRQADEGYTEKGATVNARVGESVTEVLEVNAGVEIEKRLPGNAGILSGGVSGVVRANLTDPDAKIRVGSNTQTLTFAASDFNGANLRLGYEKELVPGMLLDVSAEQEVGTGAQGPNVRALINWSF